MPPMIPMLLPLRLGFRYVVTKHTLNTAAQSRALRPGGSPQQLQRGVAHQRTRQRHGPPIRNLVVVQEQSAQPVEVTWQLQPRDHDLSRRRGNRLERSAVQGWGGGGREG
jgi:hypothetical protein